MSARPRRVLVTGSAGILGSAAVEALGSAGVEVVPFDVVEGHDVLDVDQLVDRLQGCDAVAHLAAIPTDVPGERRRTGQINVLGTWNVVLATEEVGIDRVVFASSVNAIGVFMGQNDPETFPVADGHDAQPVTPYSVAKLASEEILAAATRRSGLTTTCLRLPALMYPDRYAEMSARWRRGIDEEVSPYWEFGAYLDVRDAGRAVLQACIVEPALPHDRMILVDDRPAHRAPMGELVDTAVPARLQTAAREALARHDVLVDGSRGWQALKMRPIHHWADEVAR